MATGLPPAVSAMAAACRLSGRPWKMRLSTSSIHFMELPIEQACEKIASLGYEAVDIWSAHDKCPHLDDVKDRLGAEGLRQVLAKNNLKLSAFSVYKGGYERYAGLLGEMGGGDAIRGSAHKRPPEELTRWMKAFFERIKPLVELAERNNSRLAIENHAGALLNSPDSFKVFTDMNPSNRVGIALAPYHLQSIGADVNEVIRICGRQLFFFYAWQNFPDSQQLPGIGPTDMAPWIRALAGADYAGYVNPFMHGHPGTEVMYANLEKSRTYLLECHGKAGCGRAKRDT